MFLNSCFDPKEKMMILPLLILASSCPIPLRVYVYIYIYSIYNLFFLSILLQFSKTLVFCLSLHYNHHHSLFLSSQSYQYWSHLIRDNKMPSPRPNSTSPAPTPTNFPHHEKGLRRVIQSSTALLPPSDVKHLSS